jgi:hypothetical protein
MRNAEKYIGTRSLTSRFCRAARKRRHALRLEPHERRRVHRVRVRAIEDRRARLHAAVQRDELVVDVLVLEPVEVVEQRRDRERLVGGRRLARGVGDAAVQHLDAAAGDGGLERVPVGSLQVLGAALLGVAAENVADEEVVVAAKVGLEQQLVEDDRHRVARARPPAPAA